MVGLSGSSAIVLASFKCLLAYFQITIEDLKIRKQDLPQVILNIEKLELGISAGLQDRVVQVYGGLVHMDFSMIQFEKLGSGLYTKHDISMLPPLYLAYSTENGIITCYLLIHYIFIYLIYKNIDNDF
jgi:glucuronokinase